MKKFNIVPNGFDQEQVSSFVDSVIKQVETFSKELSIKEKQYKKELDEKDKETKTLLEKLETYESLEDTLNKAILSAQKAADQMKELAKKESTVMIEEARRNADSIVNDALLRAQKTEFETNLMRKNLTVYKKRIRTILESQIEIADDLDQVEL